MKCPKCQHDNREGRKFCAKCGEKMGWLCPKCGFENEADELFCGECGTKFNETIAPAVASIPKLEDLHAQLQSLIPDELAQKYMAAEQQAAGENRPITALFADISGFTPLSATKSSEYMFQLMQECFKQLVGIVARYEGRISGFRGDGLLALFGAPILHENDAERAILSAIDMRNMMQDKDLLVSIGINTAMMTVGEIQTELHKEYTAYGTDVNLAARLQQSAEPGQILVGTGTHRLTRRSFDFEIISDLSLKGFSQTVTAYSVQHVKAHPEKLRGIEGLRARMIGREHEFTEIKESVDQWLSGYGQIVSVIGEAGIGKSRLVTELRKSIAEKHTPNPSQEGSLADSPLTKGDKGGCENLIFEGRCVSIGQPISYWPFIDILRTYFNLKEDDDPSTIAQKVTDGTKHIFPNTSDETLPFIGRLLSVRFGNELDDRLKFATPEQIRHQTLMQLRDFFRELANKQPLLLILEDLHWSDELSLDLVTYLMDELTHAPLMLLCVYRLEKEQKVWKLDEQAQRKCLDRYTEITLRKLSSHEGRLLVEELLTIDDLPDSVKNTILEKSEGNPFFIEEVIRSLIEQDMIYHDNDRWRARSEIVNINVPDTIQSVLLSRVDRLQAEARYVLQCASVIGRLFKYRLLEHLTTQERDLNRYISEFEDRELVYEERRIPELEYAFKHALTQEATYQSILERKRKEFHHQVAISIERLYQERLEEYYEELAHHYSRSDELEKALEYILKSAKKAKEKYANDAAIAFYQQALEMMQNLGDELNPRRVEIYYALGNIYRMISKADLAQECYQKALEFCIESRMRSRLYLALEGISEDEKKKDFYLRLAQETLGDDINTPEMAQIYHLLSWKYWNKKECVLALEMVNKGLEIVKGTENYEEIVYLCISANWYSIFYTENKEIAVNYAKMCYETAELSGDPKLMAEAMLTVLRSENKSEESYRIIQKSININRRINNWDQVLHGYGWLHFHYIENDLFHHIGNGRWDKSLETIQEAYQLIQKIEKAGDKLPKFWKEWFEYAAGRIYGELGKPAEAELWYKEVVNEPDQDPARSFLIYAHIAQAYWNAGNHEKAYALLNIAMKFFAEIPREPKEQKIVLSSEASFQWVYMLKESWLYYALFPKETLKLVEDFLPSIASKPFLDKGRIYALNGRFEEALHNFQMGYQDKPWLIGENNNWNWVIDLIRKASHLEGWKEFFKLMQEKTQGYDKAQKAIQDAIDIWNQTKDE